MRKKDQNRHLIREILDLRGPDPGSSQISLALEGRVFRSESNVNRMFLWLRVVRGRDLV